MIFAFVMIYLEELGISGYLVDQVPALVVKSGDTALVVLSACITGLISMMVFSFSMVMILLNQASSNYSPRLLPGLLSNQTHQVILGIYLSTIIYCIFIALSIQPTGDKYQVPGFSVLIGIIFTILCIGAFIFFIHNISQKIQINNILHRIFKTAEKRLNKLIENQPKNISEFPSTDKWHQYYINTSGYLQNISYPNLVEICKEEETLLHVLVVQGSFVFKEEPLFKSQQKLDDKMVNKIITNFNLARGELIADNYVLAFKQITEVIVKAMSPGINDPGTALNGVDYLTELFSIRLKKNEINVITREGKSYVKFNAVSFEELLYNVMASLRIYCKNDITIVQKILMMFLYLQKQPVQEESYRKSIRVETETFLQDVKETLSNKRDLEIISRLAEKLNVDPKKRITGYQK